MYSHGQTVNSFEAVSEFSVSCMKEWWDIFANVKKGWDWSTIEEGLLLWVIVFFACTCVVFYISVSQPFGLQVPVKDKF